MDSSLEVLGRRISSGVGHPEFTRGASGRESSSGVSFYLDNWSDRRQGQSSDLRRYSSGLRSSSGVLSGLESSVALAGPEPSPGLRRTSTTPSEDDSGFGGPASWYSSQGGSFVGLLSLPVTPCGSFTSKGMYLNLIFRWVASFPLLRKVSLKYYISLFFIPWWQFFAFVLH